MLNAYCPPYAPGGAEYSMNALAEELCREGIPTHIVTPDYGTAPSVPQGVGVSTFAAPACVAPGQDFSTANWVSSSDFNDRLMDLVAKIRLPGDVIHLQGISVLESGRSLQKRGLGPVLLTLRDTSALCPSGWCMMSGKRRPPTACRNLWEQLACAWGFTSHQILTAPIYRRVFSQPKYWALWREAQQLKSEVNRLDHLVTVSDGFRDVLLHNGVGTPSTLTAIYNLPDAWPEAGMPVLGDEWRARLGLDEESRVLLVVGKRSVGKGTPWLWEAMRHVSRRHPGAVVVSVGKGAEMPPAVFWRDLKSIPNNELRSLYALADAVVVPSIWPEPFSRVLLEAMSASKPIIATNVGGSSEGVINGRSGWLVQPGDLQMLIESITDVLTMPLHALRDYGQAGHELLAQNFDRKELARKMISVYETALRNRGRAA